MSEFEKNIGFLWPCDGLNDQEYRVYLPQNIGWLTARYDADTKTELLTQANLEQYASLETLKRAARIFKSVRLDAIACGDHAASFILGKKHEEYLIANLQELSKCPVTFPSRSIIKLAQKNNFRNILLVSPYTEKITEKFVHYLFEYDINTLSSLSLEANDEMHINAFSAPVLLEKLVEFVQQNKQKPDVVILAGGGMSFASQISKFEMLTGVPILTAVGALVKDAAELAGISYNKNALGKLFFLPETSDLEKIKNSLSSGTKNFSLLEQPPIFKDGVGPVLIDEGGKSYLDFASGSGTTALGHGHKELLNVVQEQLRTGIFHIGPHFNTSIQAELYNELSSILPSELSRFHPSISGSEATEIAIKSAMHFTGANKFMGFTGGYHGRTLGALAVSGEKGKNATLGPFHPDTKIFDFPLTANSLTGRLSELEDKQLAGVIIEPIQATAGLKFAHKKSLQELREFTNRKNIPLIFDETFTGFGRTGKNFAFEHYDIIPDIIIFGKALAAGFPAGLVASKEAILTHWEKGTQSSTFQLNPVAAAASLFLIKQLNNGDILSNINNNSIAFDLGLKEIKNHTCVVDVRGIGSFYIVEFTSAELNKKIRKLALSYGLITWECGEYGECLGLVPPLNIEAAMVEKGCKIITKSVKETCPE